MLPKSFPAAGPFSTLADLPYFAGYKRVGDEDRGQDKETPEVANTTYNSHVSSRHRHRRLLRHRPSSYRAPQQRLARHPRGHPTPSQNR